MQIRDEMTLYRKKNKEFPQVMNKDALNEFSWKAIIEEWSQLMPTLYKACVAALTTKRKEKLINE